MINKEEEALSFCMKEMFLRVGEKYPNNKLTDAPNWYMIRGWTQEEEAKFGKWMVAYLRKKMRWTKTKSVAVTNAFLFQYSWTNRIPLNMRTIRKNERPI